MLSHRGVWLIEAILRLTNLPLLTTRDYLHGLYDLVLKHRCMGFGLPLEFEVIVNSPYLLISDDVLLSKQLLTVYLTSINQG